MAFVLGEVIAVTKMEILIIIFLLIVITKIIVKKQAFFAVIFLFCIIGYMITDNAIMQRDTLYNLEEGNVSVTGSVYKISESEYGVTVYLKKVYVEKTECKKLIVYADSAEGIKIGNAVVVKGSFNHFDVARNTGNFDSRFFYMTQGIYGKVKANSIQIADTAYDFSGNTMYNLRKYFSNVLNKVCNCKAGPELVEDITKDKDSVFLAMLMGDKSKLEEDVKELYSLSGISHVLAISGLHISIIGMGIYSLMRKKFRFIISAIVSLIPVLIFGMMSGFAVATVRAITMFALKLIGDVLGRNYDYTTAISFAALWMLLDCPFVLFNSGFQMSFAAIIAIMLVMEKIKDLLKIENKISEKIIGSAIISFIMAPVIAWNYYQLPTYSFLLNLVVVPLMSIVVTSGIFGMLAGGISINLGKILILPGAFVLEVYEFICEKINKVPFANVIVGKPELVTILIFYILFIVLIFILLKITEKRNEKLLKAEKQIGREGKIIESKSVILKREKRYIRKVRGVFLLGSFAIIMLMYIHLPKGFQVSFLDVGQGDGIFIRSDNGMNITIDGGSTDVKNVGEYRIIPFLKAGGIGKIDYAIITHTDADHINGLLEIMEKSDIGGVKVENIIVPLLTGFTEESYNNFVNVAKIRGINILYIKSGEYMEFGNTKIKCIHPGSTKEENINDYSTVLSLKYGELSMLFTGDISSKVEPKIKNELQGKYTFLKVPHHGSKYSTSKEFLSQINPDFSIISSGVGNSYGHPHRETLERLKENGSKILRTDMLGEITVTKSGIDKEVLLCYKRLEN